MWGKLNLWNVIEGDAKIFQNAIHFWPLSISNLTFQLNYPESQAKNNICVSSSWVKQEKTYLFLMKFIFWVKWFLSRG